MTTKIDPNRNPTKVLKFPIPAFHNLIVEPLEEEYNGIIHRLEASKEKPTEGVVIVVGPGRRTPEGKVIPVFYEPGQRVVFNRYASSEITYQGKIYLILPEDEIRAYFPK